MNIKDIANVFEELAVLLELKGENQFKIRAFSNAARSLKTLELSTDEFINELRDKGVKGFGPQLREYIFSLYETDTLAYHEELRNEFPDGLFEILKIPGLGAKKVKTLYEELQITTIEQLRDACAKDKVAALKGFAKKTQDNILQGIERYKKYSTLFRIDIAEEQAAALIDYLNKTKLCTKLETAGSLRRKKEFVKDIDIIAASKKPEDLMQAFVSYPEVQDVSGHGETKSSIVLNSGISADLRVVSPEQFSSALLHFTGSKEHNTALRTLAKKKSLKLNEYGLFKGENALPGSSEEEVYANLDLTFIPPELRENRGEVEESLSLFDKNNEFPNLICLDDIKGVLHSHSTYSDGTDTLKDLATAVKKMGYQYLGISDHSQSAIYAGGLTEDDIKRQHEEVDQLNEKLAPFRIFKGIESDILADGSLDYSEEVLSSFDFIVASVHSRLGMEEKEMTARIVAAVSNPWTTILGHPTGRLLLRREEYKINMSEILQAAAEHGVAIEINANPRRLDLDWRFHKKAKELGIVIPINPDAHSIKGVNDIKFGVGVARKGGLEAKDVLSAWDLDEVDSFFKSKKKRAGL